MFCPSDLISFIRGLGGKPNEGVHKYRVGDYALVDLLLTIVITCALFYYYAPPCWGYDKLVLIVLGVLLLSIPIHMLFGVDTEGVRQFKKLVGWGNNGGVSNLKIVMGNKLRSGLGKFGSSDSSSSDYSPWSTSSGVWTGTGTGSGESQISGPGQDVDIYPESVDSYPFAPDYWRAAPAHISTQRFSNI